MLRKSTLLLTVTSLLIALLSLSYQPVAAGASGRWSALNTLGASEASCGTLSVSGGSVSVSAPGVLAFRATDGAGTLVASANVILAPGDYFSFGPVGFAVQPASNPISAVVTVDGVEVYAGSVDNPCRARTWDPGPQPLFKDGRRNSFDPWQTSTVYCNDPNPGDISVYGLLNGEGYMAIRLNKAQLDALPTNPSRDLLLGQRNGILLYKLRSGDFMLVSPELDPSKPPYMYVFRCE